MSLGTRLTAASDALFGRLARFRFRYDLFLSYARSDGKPYALKLREQLQALDFSCFLDQDELPAGNSLRSSLSRALRRSATLVVVGTDRALRSTYVAQEVAEFTDTGRAIIPIDFQGTLTNAPWSVLRERDLVWIDETTEALTKGIPSPAVADSIDKLFKYTRRNVRVRGQILATALLFLIGAGVSAWVINGKVRELDQKTTEAKRATEAKEQATRDAQLATQQAEESRIETEKQTKEAEKQTREAKKQESIALKNAERAEERTRESQARLLATEAQRALDGSTDGLIQSVLLAAESLRKAETLEGRIALASGLRLLAPRPEVALSSGGTVRAAVFASDGRRLAVGGDEGVQVLDAADRWRALFMALKGQSVTALDFSRDGRWLAAGGGGRPEVHVLDAATGKPLAQIPIRANPPVRSLAFSPDGKYLAVAAAATPTLLEKNPEENTWQPVVPSPEFDDYYVLSVAFSGNGRWLALGGARSITVWDLARKEKVVRVESPTAWGIAFRDGDKELMSAGDREIRFWRLEEPPEGGVRLTEIEESRIANVLAIRALAPSPEERLLATANDDGTARIWGTAGREELRRMILAPGTDYPVVAWAPDGQRLVTGRGKSLDVWPARDSHEIARLTGVNVAAFSSSGRWLAVGGERTLRLLQAPQGSRTAGSWPEIARWDVEEEASIVTVSPDERWLAAVLEKKTVQVIDTRSRRVVLRREVEGEADLSALAFSPQGRWLVVTAGSAVVHRIATGTWQEAPPMELQEGLSRLAFSPDDAWIGTRTELYFVRGEGLRRPTLERVYRTETGRRVAWRSHEDEDRQGMFNRKSEQFEGPQEKQGGRMDLIRQLPVWRLIPHEAPKSVMSPDGRWKAENEYDAVNLEEPRSERTVERLPHDRLRAISFSPDGRWLVTAGSGAAKVWLFRAEDLIAEACARVPENRRPDEWPEAVRDLMAPGPCPVADE